MRANACLALALCATTLTAQAQTSAAPIERQEIRAQLTQAERDYTRQQGLFNRQLLSAQALDASLAQRDMLRARLASTGEQIRVAQESVAVAQVQAATAASLAVAHDVRTMPLNDTQEAHAA